MLVLKSVTMSDDFPENVLATLFAEVEEIDTEEQVFEKCGSGR